MSYTIIIKQEEVNKESLSQGWGVPHMKLSTTIKTSILLNCLALAGCTAETDSENVDTSGIRAEIHAVAAGDGNTGISTQLTVGGDGYFATNISLTGGDSLTATSGGTTTTMLKDKNWFTGDIFYLATLPGDATDTKFTVSFTRVKFTDAPDSSVLLPYAPALTGPSNGASFTQAASITVSWDNNISDLPVNLEFDFNCNLAAGGSAFNTVKSNVANTGTISYSVTSLLGNLTLTGSESCSAKITISREKSGTLDPNFGEGGLITAIQYRSVSVTINP